MKDMKDMKDVKDVKDVKDKNETQHGVESSTQPRLSRSDWGARKQLRVESPLTPELDRLVYELIGLGMDVHTAFGPGLREGVYEDAYVIALEGREIPYVRQVPFQVKYQGRQVRPIRLDLVVDERVVIEVKAVTQLHGIHHAQMLTYLKLTQLPVGIVLNFNVRHLKDGIRRFVRQP